MRRRRRQNPLLAKTVGAGVIVTLVLLPILATLGVFKQMHDKYVVAELVNLPPPPPQPKETPPKAKKTVHPHVESHHGPRVARAGHAAPLPVHVVASASTNSSGGTGIENGKATATGTVPPTVVPAPPVSTPTVAPPPPAPPTPVAPPVPPAPKADVIVEAEPTYQPEPVIPDDLLDSDIDMTFYAYFTIAPDGSVDVKMVKGTGNSILDRLAMDAAKQWKFTPATKNGTPVLSYRQLLVEFVVS